MRVVHQVVALIDHKPIEGEFDSIKLLDDIEFQRVRASHLARRPMPAQLDNTGVTFLLALIGAPGYFVAGLFSNDVAYFFGAAFWATVGIATYTYLAHAAKYWREHSAIRAEEVRRFGRSSFG